MARARLSTAASAVPGELDPDFRLMLGGQLDAAFAERVVDTVLEGYAAPAR